ncbi:MAG: hypothetical protein ACLUJR_05515 [Mediterraneibacter gnavus]
MDSAEKMVYEDEKLSYRTPIYLQLREIIRNRIEEGEYLCEQRFHRKINWQKRMGSIV